MTAEPTLHIAWDNTGVDVEAARRAAAEFLSALGIDYDEVTTRLEQHGLEIFDNSWRELSDQLAAALRCPRENDHAQQESGELK